MVLYLLFHYVLQINSGLATLPFMGCNHCRWAAAAVRLMPAGPKETVRLRLSGRAFYRDGHHHGKLLVATIIVLMLSGGETLETFATKRASSVLDALASPDAQHCAPHRRRYNA
jgi:cation transport ATPase